MVMSDTPNWLFVVNICGWIITFLLGLVITLLKMESVKQEGRIKLLEQEYKSLNNMVLGKYVDREYLQQVQADLVHRLETLNTKLDVILMEGRHT